MTVHSRICRLRRAAQYMAPARDLTWLAEIGKDLALVARPRSKFDRLVLTEVLVEAGLKLIDEAERSPKLTKLARACRVRNGLMLALVCTENSNSDIMVMQSAKDRVGMDTSSSLNWARERRVLI